MELHYINLDKRKDRNENMMVQLKKLSKIKVFRYEAKLINNFQLLEFYENNFISKLDYIRILSEQTSFITRGSLGCYVSHLELFKKSFLGNKILIILEDDITLHDDFENDIILGLNTLKYDFKMIYLSQSQRSWIINSTDYNDLFYKIKQCYYCTNGYIIHPTHAKFLYERLYRKYFNHIDNSILHLNVLYDIDPIYLYKKMLVKDNIKKDSNIKLKRLKTKPWYISQKIYFENHPQVKNQMRDWKILNPYFETNTVSTKEEAMEKIGLGGGFFVGKNIYCEYSLFSFLHNVHVVIIKNNSNFFGASKEYFLKFKDIIQTPENYKDDYSILILPEALIK